MRNRLILLAVLLLAACNPVANMEAADAQIEQFHALYTDGDHDGLYALTGPDFRNVTSREQFQDLVDLIDLRLGAVTSSERGGFNINTNTGGTFTAITMNTIFEQGAGTESFVFKGSGEDMELVGWNVGSQRLLLTVDDLKDSPSGEEPSPPSAAAPNSPQPLVAAPPQASSAPAPR